MDLPFLLPETHTHRRPHTHAHTHTRTHGKRRGADTRQDETHRQTDRQKSTKTHSHQHINTRHPTSHRTSRVRPHRLPHGRGPAGVGGAVAMLSSTSCPTRSTPVAAPLVLQVARSRVRYESRAPLLRELFESFDYDDSGGIDLEEFLVSMQAELGWVGLGWDGMGWDVWAGRSGAVRRVGIRLEDMYLSMQSTSPISRQHVWKHCCTAPHCCRADTGLSSA